MNLKKIVTCFFVFFIIELVFAENITITGVDGEKKVCSFSRDTDTIKLQKTIYKIKTISGLEAFPFLKNLNIGFSDLTQTDFSFLTKLNTLEVLEFEFISLKDFKFLKYSPSIKVLLLFETFSLENKMKIDLSNAKTLEFFSMDGLSYDTLFPELLISDSLKHFGFFPQYYKSIGKNYKTFFHKNLKYYMSTRVIQNLENEKIDGDILSNEEFEKLERKYRF